MKTDLPSPDTSPTPDSRVSGAAHGSRLDERDGYLAFEKTTTQMLHAAQIAKPRKLRKGYKARAEYREGYHDGILAVWCLMALVEHPRHPINAAQIRRILSSENDQAQEPAAQDSTSP